MKTSQAIPLFLIGLVVIMVVIAAIVYWIDRMKKDVSKFTTGNHGRKLIKGFEKLELEAYQDPGGVWTIGYGHISDDFLDVFPGQVISKEQADVVFEHDLQEAEAIVKARVKKPLNQLQFDALVSFVFNIGDQSQTIWRLVNEDWPEPDFKTWLQSHWISQNGRVLNGLIRRRNAEADLYWS